MEADRRQHAAEEASEALIAADRGAGPGGVGVILANREAGANDEADAPEKREGAMRGDGFVETDLACIGGDRLGNKPGESQRRNAGAEGAFHTNSPKH